MAISQYNPLLRYCKLKNSTFISAYGILLVIEIFSIFHGTFLFFNIGFFKIHLDFSKFLLRDFKTGLYPEIRLNELPN
jgi:hypothetical protein